MSWDEPEPYDAPEPEEEQREPWEEEDDELLAHWDEADEGDRRYTEAMEEAVVLESIPVPHIITTPVYRLKDVA